MKRAVFSQARRSTQVGAIPDQAHKHMIWPSTSSLKLGEASPPPIAQYPAPWKCGELTENEVASAEETGDRFVICNAHGGNHAASAP
jgi:hypothetical protein